MVRREKRYNSPVAVTLAVTVSEIRCQHIESEQRRRDELRDDYCRLPIFNYKSTEVSLLDCVGYEFPECSTFGPRRQKCTFTMEDAVYRRLRNASKWCGWWIMPSWGPARTGSPVPHW